VYIEIRKGGLAELVKSSEAIGTFAKLLSSESLKTSSMDLAGFVMANLGTLAGARVAVAGYNMGSLVLIETASAADAEQLQAGVSTLLGRSRKSTASQVQPFLVGRVVLVGPQDFATRLSQISGAVSLADDQEFAKARARFEQDQFFAYIDLGSMTRSLPGQDQSPAYTMGAMTALNSMPSAIAIGGSIAGDAAVVRAAMVNGSRPQGGLLPNLFASLASAAQTGQPMGAAFANADADLFVDVLLDWDKLYEAIQAMFAMFVSSAGSGGNGNAGAPPVQSVDILGTLEASLGFSIKHDLIPKLGGELAFSMSGLSHTLSPKQAIAGVSKSGSPRFVLMNALKDPANFERLIGRLLNRLASASAQFARTPYRGVMVNASKNIAYAIVNGFFVVGGSAAQIRRAIDAQGSGVSLASTEAFKSAFGSSQHAALQAYVSPALANELLENLARGAAKTNASPVFASAAQARMPIAIQLIPGADGMMIEARLPASLALLALASMAGEGSGRNAVTALPNGIGVSEPGPRVSGGSKTPRMTDDDLRRRP
jgi:hypothetical protein